MTVALGSCVVLAQEGKKAASPSVTRVEGTKSAAPKKETRKAKKGKAVAEDYTPEASEYGKKAKCPVSGEDLVVSADTKSVKYKGKTYYFCCPGCAPSFKKNPAKYAK
ncbi:MAG: YHS domain-containing protein [Elusimicrobia bacterium]|nr:YHS domain-containing protein [Elusimicrobiota bacterium]